MIVLMKRAQKTNPVADKEIPLTLVLPLIYGSSLGLFMGSNTDWTTGSDCLAGNARVIENSSGLYCRTNGFTNGPGYLSSKRMHPLVL